MHHAYLVPLGWEENDSNMLQVEAMLPADALPKVSVETREGTVKWAKKGGKKEKTVSVKLAKVTFAPFLASTQLVPRRFVLQDSADPTEYVWEGHGHDECKLVPVTSFRAGSRRWSLFEDVQFQDEVKKMKLDTDTIDRDSRVKSIEQLVILTRPQTGGWYDTHVDVSGFPPEVIDQFLKEGFGDHPLSYNPQKNKIRLKDYTEVSDRNECDLCGEEGGFCQCYGEAGFR